MRFRVFDDFLKKKFFEKKKQISEGDSPYGKKLKNIFSWKFLQNAFNFDLKLILGDLDGNWARTNFLGTEIAKRKIRGVPPPLRGYFEGSYFP